MQKHFFIKALAFVVVLFLILSGSFSLYVSVLPFDFVRARVDTLAPDGKADPFTAALFEGMILKLRCLGGALLLAAVGTWGMRGALHRLLIEALPSLFASFRLFLRDLRQRFHKTLKEESKIHLLFLLVFILLAIWVRFLFLFRPMRYDEAVTFVYYASKPFYVTMSNYYSANNHMLHSLLVHGAYVVFGNHPWALRLPALCAGILLVPASYMAIRILFNRHAALCAAGLMAASSAWVEYSTNARGYTLLCLIFLLLLALGATLKQNRNPFGWFLFSLLSVMGFYTMPTMIFPFGIVVLWLILSVLKEEGGPGRAAFLKSIGIYSALALSGTVLLYLPVLVTLGTHALIGDLYGPLRGPLLPERLALVRDMGYLWHRDVPFIIGFLLAVGFVISLFFHKRLASHRISLLLPILLWCVPLLLLKRAILPGRALLFLSPLYFGMASAGVFYLLRPVLSRGRRRESLIAGILAMTVSLSVCAGVVHSQLLYDSEQTGLRDVEPVVSFLKTYLREGDRVLAPIPSDVPLIYYFEREAIPMTHLYADPAASRRFVVIVNEGVHQTLAGILEETGLPAEDFSTPKVIRHYPSATLYAMDRRRAR